MTFIVNPPNEFEVYVVTDGTTTEASIVHTERGRAIVLAKGVAQRRKGNKRKPFVGSTLALQRAFREALDFLDGEVERLGYGPANDS